MAVNKKIKEERHSQFKGEVDSLTEEYDYLGTHADIARRMQEDTGNFSKYYNGVKTIGLRFFKKFHDLFSDELRRIKEKKEHKTVEKLETEQVPQTVQEANQIYNNEIQTELRDMKKMILDLQEGMNSTNTRLDSLIKELRKKKSPDKDVNQ